MRRIAILAAVLLLAACSTTVIPPPTVEVPMTAGSGPAPGKYAVMLQTGGWDLRIKARHTECASSTFAVDLNDVYESAMKQVLGRSLQNVEFVSGPLTPVEMVSGGYDAFIAVHQTNATAAFDIRVMVMFWAGYSDASLSSIIAFGDRGGTFFQQQANGSGTGDVGIILWCPDIDKAVAQATKSALQSLVASADSAVQSGLQVLRKRPGAPAAGTK